MSDDVHFRTYMPRAGFDPSEPRDEGGKWTSGGGDGGGEDKTPSAPKGPKPPSVKDVPKYAAQRHGDTHSSGAKIYDNRADPSYFANHNKLKDEEKITTGLSGRTSAKGKYYVRDWATRDEKGNPKDAIRVQPSGGVRVVDSSVYGKPEKDPHQETYDLRQHRADQTHSVMQDLKGDKHPGHGYSKSAVLRPDGSIYTTDVNDAARALFEGKKVELDQPRKVSTLIHRLGYIVANWQKTFKGEKDPKFNLCNVSVSGTNLFCAESKGIPRPQMPQLDSQQQKDFVAQLQNEGFKVSNGQEFANHLRATQNELGGIQTASNLDRLEAQKGDMTGAPPLIVSKDNYILDGHHRWAAKIGYDYSQDKLDDKLKMNIQRVDIDIMTLVAKANAFTGGKGAKEMKALQHGLIYRTQREWDESKHPRGQPGNAGQFAEVGSGGDGEKEKPAGGKPAAAEKPGKGGLSEEAHLGAGTGGNSTPAGGAVASPGVPANLIRRIEDHVDAMGGSRGQHGCSDLTKYCMLTSKDQMIKLLDDQPPNKRPTLLLHKGDEKTGMPSVWLLGWSANEGTDIHDHVKSEVGISVLRGSVVNNFQVPEGDYLAQSKTPEGANVRLQASTLHEGSSMTIPAPYIHEMFGTTKDHSKRDISVHAYYPPLKQMAYFKKDKNGNLHYDGDWDEDRPPDPTRKGMQRWPAM